QAVRARLAGVAGVGLGPRVRRAAAAAAAGRGPPHEGAVPRSLRAPHRPYPRLVRPDNWLTCCGTAANPDRPWLGTLSTVWSHRPRSIPVSRVVVDVMLKPEILDPQGDAVRAALGRLGFDSVAAVRQGKRFELALTGEVTPEAIAEVE